MDSSVVDQRVLWTPPGVAEPDPSPMIDTTLFPSYATAASLLVLLLHSSLVIIRKLWRNHAKEDDVPLDDVQQGFWRNCVAHAGGVQIVLYKFARMAALVSYVGLELRSIVQNGTSHATVFLLVPLVYATSFALFNLVSKATTARVVSVHLTWVTFVMFACYVYRDIWPLMTYTLEPVDTADGYLLWAKISLLALVGVIEPLFEPYPYVPVDPKNPSVPSPEQTASVISQIFYIYLEPVIWLAYRSPHLALDQLPPQCDYDRVKHLTKQAYPFLDRFSGAKKQNLLWSFLRTFRASFIIQALLLTVTAGARLASPVGTKYLLRYVENHGEGATVKPWVWIIWIASGPMLSTITDQMYIFLSVRLSIRAESIITSLVFDHALRIRMKAETQKVADVQPVEATPGQGSPESKTTNTSGSSTPANTSSTSATVVPSSTTTATATSGSETPQNAQAPAAKDKGSGTKEQGSSLVGKMNNLVTSDLSSISYGRHFMLILVLTPTEIAFSMWFLYATLGWSSFVGLAVMCALMPVPTWVAKATNGAQKEKMKASDKRVQRVTEAMNALRMIKLFGWEGRVQEQISEKREEELLWIWKRRLLAMLNNVVNFLPVIHMIVTYATYTSIMKQELSASVVFSSMSAFVILQQAMYGSFGFLPHIIQGYVALGRLSEFLYNTELIDEFDQENSERVVPDIAPGREDDIGFGRAHFTWAKEETDGAVTPSRTVFRLRIDEEVVFKKGVFNLIVGPTGSGKTSILMALLREMHYIPLGPDSWVNLPRQAGVAYAAQESWVLNDTIKGNILFSAPYDEERYKKVIEQCALQRDISLFDAGDQTEVGEKGITLSGGQKARVTLARAVYSSAEILLLDDVLAALDVHTAKWIVNKCFKGDLIRGRTVVLVTHNVAMASPLAEYIVSMGSDGQIASHGSVTAVLSSDLALAEEVEREKKLELEEDSNEVDPGESKDGKETKDGKLVVAEEIELGHVSRKSFMLLLANLGGVLFWVPYLTGSILTEFCETLELWWLGYWAQQYALRDPSQISALYYLGVFALIITTVVGLNVYSQLIHALGSMRACRIIHRKLMTSLVGCTFRWLDVTPISRVLTRCTQDIQAIDGPINHMFLGLTQVTLVILVKLAAVIFYTPAFLLPSFIIGIVGSWLGQVYMKSQLSVKREMSNAKAPVLAVFNSAIGGLVSIRAYSAQQEFREETISRIDRYVRAARSFWNVNRWVSIRIDTLVAFFSASLASYLIYYDTKTNPSIIGFVLAMSVAFSEMILWWVRLFNEFEVNANSLERIRQYIEIEQEPEPVEGGTPPAYWPSSGELRVEKLTAKYSPDGPEVLKEVSFEIKAGERVGVVGRTGSGKSTLTLALLRCIYTSGKVYYDGIDTSAINLDALRSNVTIIPQVPELLTGTLRHNLDMFEEYDDATLNEALRSAGLFSLQRLSDENRITLDTQIASGGGNLSVGQRQIIALARAIVRQSKLLVLDEATSAIDYETDAVIQESLRNELKSGVTVITVAHRLQTIMDSDKIMVLDAGRIVEYDSPRVLLENEKSFLRALVEDSADKETLYAMAKGKPV